MTDVVSDVQQDEVSAGSSQAGPDRHQVVVIGSGFGGLFGTKALKRADVEVTMVARTTHHLFQPLLYQVATGILSEGEIAPPTREVLARQKNARVLLGEVHSIDLDAQTVTSQVLGRTTVSPYDSLIVAAGSSQSYFGNDRFAEFAPGMKSVDDALELRGRIFGAFELAELGAAKGENVDHLLTFVVVGAGPTGVEMAGQIAELSRRTLKRDFRAINSRNARVILIDAAAQVLPPFGKTLGRKTKKQLEGLGVEVMLGAMVTDVDERGIEVRYKDGRTEQVAAVTKIWAAGVQANPLSHTLSEQTGAPLDRSGRIRVNPDLTLPGHPEVFVVGDMIDLDHLPGVAQVAIQGATYAADAIERQLSGKPPSKPFHYFDKGSMATISRFRAVALIGPLKVTGVLAWLMWLVVHIFYMTGFKNRITAVLHWAVSFLGRGRSERTATEQQIFARNALARLEHGATDLVSEPNPPDPDAAGREQDRRRDLEQQRRAELEAQAVEEARLTDDKERGQSEGRGNDRAPVDGAEASTPSEAGSSSDGQDETDELDRLASRS